MAPEDRIALARQLFALITMELEDAAALAVDGQALNAHHDQLAVRLVRSSENIALLSKAAMLVAS